MERVENTIYIESQSDDITEIKTFAKKNGIIPIKQMKQIKNGRNSRVYLIDQGRRKFILKKYYKHNNDKRNRLQTEIDFLAFLQEKQPYFPKDPALFRPLER